MVAALVVIIGVVVASIAIARQGGDEGGSTSSGETFRQRFEKNANSDEFDNVGPGDTQQLVDELGAFKGPAPDELQDDYDVLIDAANGNPGAETQTAVQNIQDYAVENCDVQLDASLVTSQLGPRHV